MALIVCAAVAHAGTPDFDRADPGLKRSLGCMAMADHTAAPFLVDLIGVHRQEGRHLGLDRVGQHLPGTFTQHSEQRIVLNRPSWPRQLNDGILCHGVSFQR
jgi:hypothetical protein